MEPSLRGHLISYLRGHLELSEPTDVYVKPTLTKQEIRLIIKDLEAVAVLVRDA